MCVYEITPLNPHLPPKWRITKLRPSGSETEKQLLLSNIPLTHTTTIFYFERYIVLLSCSLPYCIDALPLCCVVIMCGVLPNLVR